MQDGFSLLAWATGIRINAVRYNVPRASECNLVCSQEQEICYVYALVTYNNDQPL